MDTLVKKLNFVGTITTNNYELGWYIYDLVVEDKCEIVSIKPSDDFYNQWRKLNIKDKEEWITYGDCREMSFHYINEQIADWSGALYDFWKEECWEDDVDD